MTAVTELQTLPSSLDPADAMLDEVVEAGDGLVVTVAAGAALRIVDLGGNQPVAALLYDAADLDNRYSASDTVREQRRAYLTVGSLLLSANLDLLATITADTCGRHDTLSGACSQESNGVKYGEHTRHDHACRETFLQYGETVGIGVRELTDNINFFVNRPVTSDGSLGYGDGLSAPGRYVELLAARHVLVLLSNCPQRNNPVTGLNASPIRVLAWDAATSVP